jgi:hypothetical protein
MERLQDVVSLLAYIGFGVEISKPRLIVPSAAEKLSLLI